MSPMDNVPDVIELCAMLQCLGFAVKSLEIRDENASRENAGRTLSISCQVSGLHILMESPDLTCSCPDNASQNNSGFWQVSGVTGGKQHKETGSGLLGTLPRQQRDIITKELHDILARIKEHNECVTDKPKEANKSASVLELHTPEKELLKLKINTPTRYRSLDTLTAKDDVQSLPAPGTLQKGIDDKTEGTNVIEVPKLFGRQSTYTISSTPGSFRHRNKTSSPIQRSQFSKFNILDNLMSAEKGAEEIRSRISAVIAALRDEGDNDSSIISNLSLDVSKISVAKTVDISKSQFASSPNLQCLNDDITNKIKRCGSTASTSSLNVPKDGKQSRLRRISPSFLKLKKENNDEKTDKKSQERKISKLNSLFKSKVSASSSITKQTSEDKSPMLNSSRKKFSHVKSTIPKPSSRKE